MIMETHVSSKWAANHGNVTCGAEATAGTTVEALS